MFTRKIRPFLSAAYDPEDGLTVVIDTNQVPHADFAGLALADIARHFAGALASSGKADSQEAALIDLLSMFKAELRNPTDTPVGKMMD